MIKSRRLQWAGHVLRPPKEKGIHKALYGRAMGRRSQDRPRLRWIDNVRQDATKKLTGWLMVVMIPILGHRGKRSKELKRDFLESAIFMIFRLREPKTHRTGKGNRSPAVASGVAGWLKQQTGILGGQGSRSVEGCGRGGGRASDPVVHAKGVRVSKV